MENLNAQPQLGYNQTSEEEIIAMAEEILGTIPAWYLENKEFIEKKRIEQNEFNDTISAQISELLAAFDDIQQ